MMNHSIASCKRGRSKPEVLEQHSKCVSLNVRAQFSYVHVNESR